MKINKRKRVPIKEPSKECREEANLPLDNAELGEQERLMSTMAAVQSSMTGSSAFGHPLLLSRGERETAGIRVLNFTFFFFHLCN